jgi:hypothetical protein
MSAKKKCLPGAIEPNETLLYGYVRQTVVANVAGQEPAGARICLEREYPTLVARLASANVERPTLAPMSRQIESGLTTFRNISNVSSW